MTVAPRSFNPGSFNPGNFVRDGNARFNLFDANTFPAATLSGTLPLAPEMLQPGAVSRVQKTVLKGELLLRGMTQTLTAPVSVTREGEQLGAETRFLLLLSAFSVEGPSLFSVTVNDEVGVSVLLEGALTLP